MTPADRSHRAKLIVCFAIVYLVWGSTYLVASIGVHALPPFLFGGIRFICAGILLGLVALALGRRFELDATEWRHMFIVAVGNVLIPNGCDQLGDAARGVEPDRDPQRLGGTVDRAVRDARPARARARPAHAHRPRDRLRRRGAHRLAARQPARPAISACSC